MPTVLSVKPAIEPVTLAEMKLHLRVDSTTDDSLIDSLIEAARSQAELVTRRQFITATWKLYLDEFPDGIEAIPIPFPPLQATGLVIKYYDSDNVQQTWAAAKYETDTAVEPGRVRPVHGEYYPETYDRLNAVEVAYVAGYGARTADVPEGIRAAIKLLAANLYEHREATAEKTFTVVPLAIESLLWQFRVMELR